MFRGMSTGFVTVFSSPGEPNVILISLSDARVGRPDRRAEGV